MRFLPLVLFLATAVPAEADTPRREVPMVTASASGRYFFTMLPTQWKGQGEIAREPFGITYELRDDGSLRELWRVKGWYAFRCFLSDDGRYLVAVYDQPIGHKPSNEDVAVAFYDRGKRLGQFSTADLVKDTSKVGPSASLREWFFRKREIAKEFYGPEDPCFIGEHNFSLTTVDGISYTFDATRGAITATRQVVIPPAE